MGLFGFGKKKSKKEEMCIRDRYTRDLLDAIPGGKLQLGLD